jgi:O-antigen/teichoic acid export membrane protein
MSKIKGFIGETLIYGLGNVFSRVFAMILIPFYASFLGKIDYSNLVMLQSFFTILTFLLALNTGVFFYYYEYENPKYRKIVFTSWFYYELFISLVFIALIAVFSKLLCNIFIINSKNSFELSVSLLLMGVQLIPYVFNNTNINLFRINRKPKNVISIVFFESLFTFSFVYATLYLFHWGLIGVAVGQLAARVLITLFFVNTSRFYINKNYFSISLLKKILLYTWPYFVISIFGWVITSMDKFIGTKVLTDKTDVAILSLAMQLVIPISVLADMIRMALGPFIMSIHKENDAQDTYQKVFDLTIFTSTLVVVVLVAATPVLTLMLTDKSFMTVIYVVPLMAFASIFSLAANQFTVSFNLVSKNIYILIATIAAGLVGMFVNFFFMQKGGIVVSGISQIASYLVLGSILFILGKRIANLQIKLFNSSIILVILVVFILIVLKNSEAVFEGDYLLLFISSIITIFVLILIYLRLSNIKIGLILKNLLKKG